MKTAPAHSHADRAKTLASMPPLLQVEMLRHHGLQMDKNWMDSAREDGHFDAMESGHSDDGQALDLIASKLMAVSSFSVRCKVDRVETDPFLGPLSKPVVHLVASPELDEACEKGFKASYEKLIAHVVGQIKNEPLNGDVSPFDPPEKKPTKINLAFATAMACCVILDLPESVRLISSRFPGAMNAHLDTPSFLGLESKQWDQKAFNFWDHAHLKPYGIALFFSRHACMQTMAEEGVDLLDIGKRENQQGNLAFHALNFSKHTAMMGLPSAFQLAIEHHQKAHGAAEDDPDAYSFSASGHHALACKAFEPGKGQNDLDHYIDAFHASGVYRTDPTATLHAALLAGNAAEVKRVDQPVAWSSISDMDNDPEDHVFMRAFSALEKKNKDSDPLLKKNYEDAFIAVIDKAVQEGALGCVLDTVVVKTKETVGLSHPLKIVEVAKVQPMASIVENDCLRVMLRLMDAGLNARKPLHEGVDSLVDFSDKAGFKKTADVMRAHAARSVSHDLLKDFSKPSF